jgi:hypothetical protein
MPRSSKDDSPRRNALDDFVRGLRRAAALKAALELEVFTRIAEGNRSLPAFLKSTGMNERGARLLLDALVNINLLNRTTFEYSLTPASETYLVKGKPTYYGDALLARMAWDARGQTARSVKGGKPLAGLAGEGNAGRPLTRWSATWVDWQAVAQGFEPILEELGLLPPTESAIRILVMGAEGGVRLVPLLQRNAAARLVVVDGAIGLASLRDVLQDQNVDARVELLEGDLASVALPRDSFDHAFVDSVTSTRSLEQNIGILHRVLECIRLGGRIILRAAIADDDRRGPELIPLLGLDLLISSSEGDIYTVTEYRGMLEAAGFFEVKPVGERHDAITARRIPPPPPPPPVDTVAPDFIPAPETLD